MPRREEPRNLEFAGIKTLSGLLSVMVEDGRRLLDDGRYEPTYNMYHGETDELGLYAGEGRCFACAAGAIMAFRLGAQFGQMVLPTDFCGAEKMRLYAVDELRRGHLIGALMRLIVEKEEDLADAWKDRQRSSDLCDRLDAATGGWNGNIDIPHGEFDGVGEYGMFLRELEELRDKLRAGGL